MRSSLKNIGVAFAWTAGLLQPPSLMKEVYLLCTLIMCVRKYICHEENSSRASARCHTSSHIPQALSADREKGSLTLHLRVNDLRPFVSNWKLRHLHWTINNSSGEAAVTSSSKSRLRASDKVHSTLRYSSLSTVPLHFSVQMIGTTTLCVSTWRCTDKCERIALLVWLKV